MNLTIRTHSGQKEISRVNAKSYFSDRKTYSFLLTDEQSDNAQIRLTSSSIEIRVDGWFGVNSERVLFEFEEGRELSRETLKSITVSEGGLRGSKTCYLGARERT